MAKKQQSRAHTWLDRNVWELEVHGENVDCGDANRRLSELLPQARLNRAPGAVFGSDLSWSWWTISIGPDSWVRDAHTSHESTTRPASGMLSLWRGEH
jgi:hypothetical protein